MGAFLTAWINNFISPINSLPSFGTEIFTSYEKYGLFFSPPSSHFLELLSLNTTTGPFRKLGRLYESCLRQQLNSSTIRLTIEKLGGYLPVNALGPSTVTPLLVNMMEMGSPLPLLDIYYDLSYGRKPQVLLIIDIPTDVHHILQVWSEKTGWYVWLETWPFFFFRILSDGLHRKLQHSKLMRTCRRCWMTSWSTSFLWDCPSSKESRSDSQFTVLFANWTKYVRIISTATSLTAMS